MSENLEQKNKSRSKKYFIFLVILASVIAGYFAFQYWQASKAKERILKAKVENISESEIFDLSDEYKSQINNNDDSSRVLSELNINELRERGPEFIYQVILKNQIQINDLKTQIQELRTEFVKYKNNEKIGRLIFTYIDLRQKIYSGAPYEEAMKNLEMLAFFDKNLQGKIFKLKEAARHFSTAKKLDKDLEKLIPDLIATKNIKSQDSLFDKIRYQLSKLVVIRKIGGKNSNVDLAIVETQKFLQEDNYQEALNKMLALDKKYNKILEKFLEDLAASLELQRLDLEIFNYLKNST